MTTKNHVIDGGYSEKVINETKKMGECRIAVKMIDGQLIPYILETGKVIKHAKIEVHQAVEEIGTVVIVAPQYVERIENE